MVILNPHKTYGLSPLTSTSFDSHNHHVPTLPSHLHTIIHKNSNFRFMAHSCCSAYTFISINGGSKVECFYHAVHILFLFRFVSFFFLFALLATYYSTFTLKNDKSLVSKQNTEPETWKTRSISSSSSCFRYQTRHKKLQLETFLSLDATWAAVVHTTIIEPDEWMNEQVLWSEEYLCRRHRGSPWLVRKNNT